MGAALEVLTVQHERAAAPRQVRISRNVRRAIDAMVLQGEKRARAAEIAGITDEAMRKAMHKPEVLAYMNTQQQALRTSAAARSIARIDNLADGSDSDHVKLDANKFLLGIEGVSPVQKSESINVHKHLMPGLTIVMGAWSPHGDDAHLIDGQAHQSENKHQIKMLGTSVPHPLAGNASK